MVDLEPRRLQPDEPLLRVAHLLGAALVRVLVGVQCVKLFASKSYVMAAFLDFERGLQHRNSHALHIII